MAWDYEKVVRELQDTMTVVVGIQARQASLLKDQSTWLESLQERQDEEKRARDEQRKAQEEQRKSLELHEKRMAHIDQTLLEIGDKLNGLIGYMDNQNRPQG